MGEYEYMRRARADTTSWIRAHPADFLSLTARRAWLMWFGSPLRPLDALPVATLTILALVGLVRAWPDLGSPQRAAIVIALAAYPLVYYVVGYVQRYTYPTVGLLLVLAGAAVAGPRSFRAPAP